MRWGMIAFAATAAYAPAAFADDEEFDKQVRSELEALNRDALSDFDEAESAKQRGEWEKASAAYAKVSELAPAFFHAVRRRCSVELQRGQRELAKDLCRRALDQKRTPENLAAMANVLVRTDNKDDAAVARNLIDEGGAALADKDWAQETICTAAVRLDDRSRLRTCSTKLVALQPDSASGYYFAAVADAYDEHWSDARASLENAHAHGLPDEMYAGFSKNLSSATPLHIWLWDRVSIYLAVWTLSFGSLVIIGFLLSALALRASRRVPNEASGHARGVDAWLRRVYRLVLWGTCAFYYVSLPIVSLSVVAVGGALIYAIFAVGHIPIKLVLIIAVTVLATLGAVVKALFVRTVDADPGMALALGDHPKLKRALEEVAGRVGTRTVDTVYMTPGTDMAVMERGGMVAQLRGHTERCLILGAGVLDGLKIRELKSVLAHEYGHFQNEDTAGGGFSLAVRRSLLTMARSLAISGAAAWYNPAWLFLRAFFWIFLRISHGASRLQEVLADRWAAFSYGSTSFENGMRKVIEQSIRFHKHAGASLKEAVEQKIPLPNLYLHRPSKPPSETEISTSLEEEMNAPATPFDSHPPPAERIAWVRALNATGAEAAIDDLDPAWHLFQEPEKVQAAMTAEIRSSILRAEGIAISA